MIQHGKGRNAVVWQYRKHAGVRVVTIVTTRNIGRGNKIAYSIHLMWKQKLKKSIPDDHSWKQTDETERRIMALKTFLRTVSTSVSAVGFDRLNPDGDGSNNRKMIWGGIIAIALGFMLFHITQVGCFGR